MSRKRHSNALFSSSRRRAEQEAKARIKINKLLEEAGLRFFDNKEG